MFLVTRLYSKFAHVLLLNPVGPFKMEIPFDFNKCIGVRSVRSAGFSHLEIPNY